MTPFLEMVVQDLGEVVAQTSAAGAEGARAQVVLPGDLRQRLLANEVIPDNQPIHGGGTLDIIAQGQRRDTARLEIQVEIIAELLGQIIALPPLLITQQVGQPPNDRVESEVQESRIRRRLPGEFLISIGEGEVSLLNKILIILGPAPDPRPFDRAVDQLRIIQGHFQSPGQRLDRWQS